MAAVNLFIRLNFDKRCEYVNYTIKNKTYVTLQLWNECNLQTRIINAQNPKKIMKTLKFISTLSTAAILCLSPVAYGQNGGSGDGQAFGKGSNILSLGIGLGGDYIYDGPGYTSSPNFVLTYDNGTFGNVGPGTISLGLLFSYKGASYSYTDFHSE